MDATPPACAPASAYCSLVGRILRAKFLHSQGIEAFVAATPGLTAHAQASHAQLIHLQADRFVVTTPSAALASTKCNNAARPVCRTQHGSNLVTLSPRPHSQCSDREKAGLSGYETAARMRTVARTGHDIASRAGCRALALTQVPQAQQEYSAFSIHTLASMTERPLTVTQHLQALHDMATSSGMEGMDDKAASLFASLDRVWFETHREKLTSPAFAENLKTFMLIRGGIAPSSPEAVPIVARAKAMTKLRLRLHVERGSDHGRDPEKGGQVDTSAQATSSVPLERRGVIVSAALKQTHRQTRSGWMAASSAAGM